ncbi:YwqG family protein [Entamoeba marina]
MSKDQDKQAIIEKVVGEIVSSTSIPAIKFDLVEEETTVFDSKIGGKPYLPKDFEYPKLKNGDHHPLVLLVQINYEQLEHIEDFPETGMLQIYIDGTDYSYDFDGDEKQNGFRVVYHENIIKDESLLVDPPEVETEAVPFECCLKIIGKKIDCPMNWTDFRMDALIDKYMVKYNLDKQDRYTITDSEQLNCRITGFGGYASFTQDDPRGWGGEKDYTTTLFTSEYDTNNKVCWGDAGTGNFFIKREDLLKKDFSDVFFTYDCC